MNPGQSAKETMHRKKPSWLRRLQSPSGLACSSAGTCSPSLGTPFNRLLKKWNRAPVGAVYGAMKKLPSQLVKCRMSVVRCLMRLRAIALALRGPPLQIFLLYSRRGGLNVEDQAVCSVD